MQSAKSTRQDATDAVCQGLYSFGAHMVEMHAAKPNDPRLRLAYPLESRKILMCHGKDLGSTTETQLAVESVGNNGVRRVVALLRLTTTDRAAERF